MKTKLYIPLQLLVLPALLLAVSPQINLPAAAVELRLSSECSSNKLILHWNGGPGIRLQQVTNLANPNWLDLPGTEGANSCELPMTNTAAFFRLLSRGTSADADSDGLDGWFEELGWTIYIDASGYGEPRLVELHVTSDPGLADTDGDGISDFWEWMLGTNPRMADTDGDGLSDYEEWVRWHTSPTSVDTDGDARGPNHDLPPKAQLFDGNELSLLRTSPTLADSDGDGRTDYEEYDQSGRSPLIAELPKLDVQMVDAVDIRLDVQYAEEGGTSRQYGGQLTTSESMENMSSSAHSVNASLKIGGESEVGFFKAEAKMTTELTVGWQGTWTSQTTASKSTENSYSDYTTDSRTRTETAASGSMSGGVRLVNTGPVTYTLTDFGLTVRYWSPGTGSTNGEFKTLATLVPALGVNGITLAPGDSTPVLQVQATGLNASRVKEFMARPNSLQLEPAFYEMQNAEGLNFDFLEEVTRWRTARVEIDYGNGTSEEYRVATNVERNEDGTYAGVTMGFVMSNILHVPYQTTNLQALVPTNASNERVLYQVRNVVTTSATNGFWIVTLSGEGTPLEHPNFAEIVLQAGDEILLSFIRDDDGDGLFNPEEQHYGTDDNATTDSDGDWLPDVFEARTGWDVVLPGRTYHVYSDPRVADQDGDGLTDSYELELGTDPTKSDTDDDGLADGVDPFPTVPAKVLRVKWDATGLNNGSSWGNALTNLQDALTLARNGLATTGNPADDVAEIWVAAGVYKPTTDSNDKYAYFSLVNNVALYGGFSGVETKLSQRESNPLYNGTVLSGDLLNNDASTYGENPNTFADNSYRVCRAGYDVGSGTVLDGFTITGGNNPDSWGGGMDSIGHPQLRNLAFRANYAYAGGGLFQNDSEGAGELLVSDCLFLQNSADVAGGGIYFNGDYVEGSSGLVLTNCQFLQNESRHKTEVNAAVAYGGGGAVVYAVRVTMDNCTFTLNTSSNYGGGLLLLTPVSARLSRSEFRDNTAFGSGAAGGGLACMRATDSANASAFEVVQCVFWHNQSPQGFAGAVYSATTNPLSVYILDSTFSKNVTYSAAVPGAVVAILGAAAGFVENSVLWDNTGGNYFGVLKVRNSCLSEASYFPGAGNINADPKFVDGAGGDLRLQSGSPCIDKGNNYADYYPRIPGLQLLPGTDLDGSPRVVDGNNDGTATVDMGAYENQGK